MPLPIPGWNDDFEAPYTPGVDYRSARFANLFVAALNERGPGSASFGSGFLDPAEVYNPAYAGFPTAFSRTLFSSSKFWGNGNSASVGLQQKAEGVNRIDAGGGANRYVLPGGTYDGRVTPPTTIAVTGPLFVGQYLDFAAFMTARHGAPTWRRKYRRRIALPTSTAYLNPTTHVSYPTDAVANGHRAICERDFRVYLRAGGAWALEPPGTDPDLVETFGQCGIYDQFGGWILNDLRDWINAMVWLGETAVVGSRTYREGFSDGTDTTAAAAQAAAAGDWAANAPAFTIDPPGAYTALSQGTGGLFGAYGVGRRGNYSMGVSGTPHATGQTYAVDLYLYADDPDGANDPALYSAAGTGLAQRTWKHVETQTTTVGGPATVSAFYGDVATFPTPWPATPGPGASTKIGYGVVRGSKIVRCDVPGGYQFTAST
jgi:hypothetical protein